MALLGLDRVDRHDNFFQLGGDSILAAQVLARIRDTWGVELSIGQLFEASTVAAIADRIAARVDPLAPTPVARIQAQPRDRAVPLSYAQERLWFIDQLGISQHAYHLLDAARLLGPVNVAALERSLTEITRRHDILRTTFIEVEGAVVQVVNAVVGVPLPVVDLQRMPTQQREGQVHELAREQVRQAFDLARGPLLRARLLRLEAETHVLIVTMHHIVFDDWSHGVFWRELATLYQAFSRGDASPLPELTIQYADAALWQRQALEGEVGRQQLDYWRGQLAGAVPPDILTDHPHPAVQTFRGARHRFVLSPELTQGLKALSQAQHVTLFMTLLAAVQVVLYRYTGQGDVLVGSLMANRNRVEVENLIGFWINTLVLRTELSDNPRFDALLGRVRDTTTSAYRHGDMPFEKLLEALQVERDLSRSPLFQVLFVLHNLPRQVPEIPGLALCPLEIDSASARFDITLDMWERAEGLQGWLEYNADLFEATTIARLARHLETVLEGVVRAPEQSLSTLPLLTERERQQLLVAWCAAEVPLPREDRLHRYFESQVRQAPDAIALIEPEAHVTYRVLNRRANQVAHYLRAQGVCAEDWVGFYVTRSIDMVVGLLGILKADAAYVPLDPAYPLERLRWMAADAQLAVVLTQAHGFEAAPVLAGPTRTVYLDADWPHIARYPAYNPASAVSLESLATVLYTSGSTGEPKGVFGSHGAMVNVLCWLWRQFPFTPYETACHKTSLSFVDAVQELLAPLLQGTAVVIVSDDVVHDPTRLVRTLAQHHVTRLILVPSLLRALFEADTEIGRHLPDLTLWFAGGEALSMDLVQHFYEALPGRRLINLYGATEDAADVTWYETATPRHSRARVPIGRPVDNMRAYVLDTHQLLVPVGQGGELCVGGIGLAQGYLNHPAETAARFVPNPYGAAAGARLYKTGDVVRYRSDGNLEYLGRLDQQVQIRGHRIELGDLESALEQHPSVQRAVVVVTEDTPGDQRLVAYVVQTPGIAPNGRVLRRFLQARLPDYMRPSRFVTLDELPLTPTGKVDRRALPAPDRVRPELEVSFLAPRSATEEVVAGIWAELFGMDHVGVHDRFFDLGGHSLLAVHVVSRLRHALRVDVPLQVLFEAPTVAALSRYVETASRAGCDTAIAAITPMPRDGGAPLSMVQEACWHLEQLIPGTGLLNIPFTMRLTGVLDVAALRVQSQPNRPAPRYLAHRFYEDCRWQSGTTRVAVHACRGFGQRFAAVARS